MADSPCSGDRTAKSDGFPNLVNESDDEKYLVGMLNEAGASD